MSSVFLLKFFIEKKRTMMINSANKYGMNAEITIQHSQELDELLNEYRKLVMAKKERAFANVHH